MTPLMAAIFSGLLVWQGCALVFSGENFQRLRVFFQLTESLTEGEARLVHTWVFPTATKVRKNWVRLSGRLTAADDGELPSRVTIIARFEDIESGKQQARVVFNVNVGDDGIFSARKKLSKNISADSMMMVTVEPDGADLAEDTGLTLCVDLVEKKKDLNTLPDCVESDEPEPDPDAVTLTQLQNNLFTKTCALGGCHNAATARGSLILEAGRTFGETVNVPSTGRPLFDIIEPGDPESSYMVKKLRGDADIVGGRMPFGGPFLSDERLAEVISWINAGARDN